MSPPPLGMAEEEGDSNATVLISSASKDSRHQNASELKERNYMGISETSSGDSSVISAVSDETKIGLNLKATELRLGLPGSQFPEGDLGPLPILSSAALDEKPLFPLYPTSNASLKAVVAGNKRGFCDAMEGKFLSNSGNLGLKPSSDLENLVAQSNRGKDSVAHKLAQEKPLGSNSNDARNSNSSAPASKAQVVGWPPIRSFRKNSLASTSKNADEVEGKSGVGALFVKVSMDGAPYLRKVDLRNHTRYQELSSALDKMFSYFTIGQQGSGEASGSEMISESNLKDLLHGSEYALTYEDKDGDWMLVGDVPWEMFIYTCKRLRIMKSSDAIGLAPRAMEKCRNRN